MHNSRYLDSSEVIGFFKSQSINTETTEEFWQKAIPAAEQLGFSFEANATRKLITIHTPPPNQDRFVYGGLDVTSQTHLGIAFAHAILSAKLHD